MAKHAVFSPSGAPAWTRCHAKLHREIPYPDASSEFADEGTAAHFLRDLCLREGHDPIRYKGRQISVHSEYPADWAENHAFGIKQEGRTFEVDHEMATAVGESIHQLKDLLCDVDVHHAVHEQALSIEAITGEEGAQGTVDFSALAGRVLLVDDLKYGRGVQVFAHNNEQLLIYGVAALDELDLVGDVEELWLHINQPRLNHFDLWKLPVAEACERIRQIRAAADLIRATPPEKLSATPGEKQCKFCRAKGACAEYRDSVLGTVTDDFVDLTKGELAVSVIDAERILANAYGVKPKAVTFELAGDTGRFVIAKPSLQPQLKEAMDRIASADDQHLATCMDAVDMVEAWCKGVRAEVERRLLAGQFTDARYKLVAGKRGARQWTDEEQAEATLKAMRLKVDQMYQMKVISPTKAEEVLAAANPRKWKKLQDLIEQPEGKPSVAPASDKRPALALTVAFDPIPDEPPAAQQPPAVELAEDLI